MPDDAEELESELPPNQERFCQEYLKDLNATQAAIRAGYAEKAARQQGSRLLTNAAVKDRVNELLIERGDRVRIDSDYVLQNLATVAERCMQRAPVMIRRGQNLVQKIDADGNHVWEFDSSGANVALGLLGRHLKLFADRIEHTGKDGKPIEHKDVTALPDDKLDARIAMLLAKRGEKTE